MPRPTILQALRDPDVFGPLKLDGPSWATWRVILAAAYGLPLGKAGQEAFTKLTGRQYSPPRGGWRTVVIIAARQCGKSTIAGLVAAFESLFPTVEAPNLRAVLVAQSEDDARLTLLPYVRRPFERSKALKAAIVGETRFTTTLRTGVVISTFPCDPRSVRGPSAVCVVLDELAHYRGSSGEPLDVRIVEAAEPSLFSTKGRMWIMSSPYSESGRLWELHRDYFGKDDPRVLVVKADSLTLNPTLDAEALEEFRRINPDAAVSEVDANFRANLSKLIDPQALALCVEAERTLRPPEPGATYTLFVDSASGSKVNRDRFTMAIAHEGRDKTILDVVGIWIPPFSTRDVIRQIAELAAPYKVKNAMGDRVGMGFIEDAFREHGLVYEQVDSNHTASKNLLEFEKMVNVQAVSLLDHPEMLREFRILDRVRSLSGDRVDHPRGTHDDMAVSAAGALVLAREAAHRGVSAGGCVAVTKSLVPFVTPAGLSNDFVTTHPHERDGAYGDGYGERWLDVFSPGRWKTRGGI